MSPTARYGLTSGGAVGLVAVLAALLLDRRGGLGVAVAGAVALPVQVGLFALMARTRPGTNGFLAAWVGGMLARVVVLAVVAVVFVGSGRLPGPATLLGMVGFFFGMVLMEPYFLGLRTLRGESELRSE